MATFSERLNYLLEHSGKSQQEVADSIGVVKSTMSLWLSGKRGAKLDKVELLSKLFDVDPVWLLGFDVPMKPGSVDAAALEEENLLKEYRKLPVDFKKAIQQQISLYLSLMK